VAAPPELRIGRLLKAHGVKGALRLELLTDFPDRFAAGAQVLVDGRVLRIKRSKPADDGLIVSFVEIDDRTQAEALVGHYCTLPLDRARELPDDHYYHFQLIGLSVVDAAQQRQLGRVEEVLPYAANDVLRVNDGRVDTLIPMVKQIVKSIDRKAGIITVRLPEDTQA